MFAGDFHWGSRQCDEALLKKFVNIYKDAPQTKVILMGDELDAVTRTDKRFTAKSMHPRYVEWDHPIDLMVEDLYEILKPLQGKIIAGVDSNHNTTYRGVSGSDVHYRLSRLLGFERLGYGGWVCILWDWHKKKANSRNRVRSSIFHVTHGKPSHASTKAGKLATMEKDGWYFNSDVLVHGHTHLLANWPANMSFDPMPGKSDYAKIKQRLVNSGSFLKSYSKDEWAPYSEVRRYEPIDMGWATVDVEFHEGEPKYSITTKEF